MRAETAICWVAADVSCVVAARGASVDAEELRAYVRANLARYKVPRDVVLLDELPRNASGKVVVRDLPGTE